MRRIKITPGLLIDIHHAGTGVEAITDVSVSIPLNTEKYLTENLIDSIAERLLPDIHAKLDAITQEFTESELSDIRGWLKTGIIGAGTYSLYPEEIEYLINVDDAVNGIVNFAPGTTSPTYS
jgi:hypothetical protein